MDQETEAPLDDLEAIEEPEDAELGDGASSSGRYTGGGSADSSG
jgi:hypothetical protein